MKVAIPTSGSGGLEDTISDHFGHAPTFTIVEVVDGRVKDIKIIDNPVLEASRGRGRILSAKLSELGVEAVIAPNIGSGMISWLNSLGIKWIKVEYGGRVVEVLKSKGFLK